VRGRITHHPAWRRPADGGLDQPPDGSHGLGSVGDGDAHTADTGDAAKLASRGGAVGHVVEHVRRQHHVRDAVSHRQADDVTVDHAAPSVGGQQHPQRQVTAGRIHTPVASCPQVGTVAAPTSSTRCRGERRRRPGPKPTRSNRGSCESHSRCRARRLVSSTYCPAGFNRMRGVTLTACPIPGADGTAGSPSGNRYRLARRATAATEAAAGGCPRADSAVHVCCGGAATTRLPRGTTTGCRHPTTTLWRARRLRLVGAVTEQRTLDLRCGQGRIEWYLARWGDDVVGVDLSGPGASWTSLAPVRPPDPLRPRRRGWVRNS
jgi:hypothetical protein